MEFHQVLGRQRWQSCEEICSYNRAQGYG
ncbi:hypothetical protein OESDEN_21777 [Oesophagostomum dentatum]|uniref:Uncharacterized protein n=1 Tax=Oesophagostomum dentatum TaxID=61180 RepID=A0A0B1S5X6_OESDE|nr:hypothetical protein OESDEN_21777 [Oesophagostomum dentatum]